MSHSFLTPTVYKAHFRPWAKNIFIPWCFFTSLVLKIRFYDPSRSPLTGHKNEFSKLVREKKPRDEKLVFSPKIIIIKKGVEYHIIHMDLMSYHKQKIYIFRVLKFILKNIY